MYLRTFELYFFKSTLKSPYPQKKKSTEKKNGDRMLLNILFHLKQKNK